MKKLFRFLFLPLLLLSCSNKESFDYYSDELDETFSFTLLEDNTYGISAKNKDINGDIIIPDIYRGEKVTHIIDEGFYHCERITKVTIGNNITTIGKRSFCLCGSYENDLIIPDNVIEIMDSAFFNYRMNNLIIGDGVKTIERSAFGGCDFNNLTLGNSIEYLGRSAFGSNKIKAISLPASINEMEPGALLGLNMLEKIDVDESNKHFKTIDNVLFNYNLSDLVCYPRGKTGIEYYIPQGTININTESFFDLPYLERLVFSSSVKTVCEYAIIGNNKLKNIVLNEGLLMIDESGFGQNYNLATIHLPTSLSQLSEAAFANSIGPSFALTVEPSNNHFTVYNEALYSKDLKIMYYCFTNSETYSIFETTEELGSSSIQYLFNTKRIVTNTGLKKIRTVFSQTIALESIFFSDTIEALPINAFFGSSKLKEVNIPPLIKELPSGLLYSCSGITHLDLPNSIDKICYLSLYGTINLSEINYMGTLDEWNEIIIENKATDHDIIIHCLNQDTMLLKN